MLSPMSLPSWLDLRRDGDGRACNGVHRAFDRELALKPRSVRYFTKWATKMPRGRKLSPSQDAVIPRS